MKTLTNYPTSNILFPNFNQWLDVISDKAWNSGKLMNEAGNIAAMNVKETSDGYEVELAAPGFKKENFTLKVENNVLHISAKSENKTESTEGKYTRREFSYQEVERSLRLGNNIDADKIAANYTDGILSVKLPRKVEEKPDAQHISVQ